MTILPSSLLYCSIHFEDRQEEGGFFCEVEQTSAALFSALTLKKLDSYYISTGIFAGAWPNGEFACCLGDTEAKLSRCCYPWFLRLFNFFMNFPTYGLIILGLFTSSDGLFVWLFLAADVDCSSGFKQTAVLGPSHFLIIYSSLCRFCDGGSLYFG